MDELKPYLDQFEDAAELVFVKKDSSNILRKQDIQGEGTANKTKKSEGNWHLIFAVLYEN